MDYKVTTQEVIMNVTANVDSIWRKEGNGILCMGFSDADQMRAYAEPITQSGPVSSYMIGVMRPLLYVIHEYLRIFLSNNTVFSGIGQSSHLIKVPTVRARSISELESYIRENQEESIFNEDRKKLHYFLFTLATEFILIHELNHILNGHIDLLLSCKKSGEKLTKQDIQTLELDADACTICTMYDVHSKLVHGENLAPPELANGESIMYCLFFNNLLMMSVFSYFSMTLEMLSEKTHPNPYTRCMIAFGSLYASILHNKPQLGNRVPDIFFQVMQDFMRCYDIVIEDSEKEEFYWTFNPDNVANDYTLHLAKHWNSLRPKLEKYAMVELSPLYAPGQ